MYKVQFSENIITTIDQYSLRYREYFRSLYEDSGIWDEQRIIEGYIDESIFRIEEIYALLHTIFLQDIILGRKIGNTLSLPWRTKTLLISWREEGDTRIIETLKIT